MQNSEVENTAKVASVAELFLYYDEQFVRTAYHFFLGRDPDPEGLGNYLEQLRSGTPRHQVARLLSLSAEAKRRRMIMSDTIGVNNCLGGKDYAPSTASLQELNILSDRAFVEAAYQTVLGRETDADGMINCLRQLRSGKSKMGILNDLMRSVEFSAHKEIVLKQIEDSNNLNPSKISAREQMLILEKAATKYRLGQLPILGGLFRVIFDVECESKAERRFRRLESQLHLLSSQDFDAIEERVITHPNPAHREIHKDNRTHTRHDVSLSKKNSDVTIVRSASNKLRTLSPVHDHFKSSID